MYFIILVLFVSIVADLHLIGSGVLPRDDYINLNTLIILKQMIVILRPTRETWQRREWNRQFQQESFKERWTHFTCIFKQKI